MSAFSMKLQPGSIGSESEEAHDLKQMLLDAQWDRPAMDYNEQGSYSSVSAIEIELHLSNGQMLTVYDMGNNLYGIARDWKFPEFVFESLDLSIWIAAHSVSE